ncbi:hypothetical protein HYU07_00365 [Candidatus Woesearchaeota archaeon]|nr:hypothetical protein [Candidatus Woesearchaeota archaeon]
MNSNNQKMQIKNLELIGSKSKRVYDILMLHPDMVFGIKSMANIYNEIYKDNTCNSAISTIMTRLYAKNKIIRTPTQLKSGYFYSVSNRVKLRRIYDDYLVPSDLEHKENIKELILEDTFENLEINHKLNFDEIGEFGFVKKYGLTLFYDEHVLNFLVTNIGFLMGDGHVRKNLQQAEYDFNQNKDAVEFRLYFNSIFKGEYLSLKYNQFCFRIVFCSKGFAELLIYLGVPCGNKVFTPFLIPDWIYNGPDKIKKTFLSIIYGNEGSKPQNNVWRIQFVLSKNKNHVTNLLEFLNQIRAMLAHFGIATSHIQLRKQKGREFCGRFYIKGKENLLKFYNKIGFAYASEKQEVLEALLKRGKLIN